MDPASPPAPKRPPAASPEAPRLGGGVLVIGPLPPPVMGPSLQTPMVCDGLARGGARVFHVDTRDERTVFNVGILDLRNVALALLHGARVFRVARLDAVDLVYVPISQGRWGYVRDALLLTIVRLLGKRSLVHLHGANFQSFYRASTPVERWIIRRTLAWQGLAVACTPGLRGVFEGLVPADRVRVLENGIPDPFPGGVEAELAARRSRAESDPAAMRLLYIANDFTIKGAATAVRALAEDGLERCELRLAGAPPAAVAERTRALAAELGVGTRVTLLGPIDEAVKRFELAAADAFVYPTENDAQPLVVLEALAAGLPIVTSTFGGVPDTVDGAGLLVEPRDHRAVAERLRSLVEDPERRAVLGELARSRFRERYTPAAFDDRLARLFAELVGSRSTWSA